MTSTRRRPVRGPHPHPPAGAEQVAALDQLDAHRPGQQRVLEVRAVEDARRQHHDRRVVHARRGGGRERGEQPPRVVGDRPDPQGGEQLGEDLRHGTPVRQHVADTAGHPDVVLQHPERALRVADQVDAGDVHPHAVGRLDALRGPVEVLGGGDQPPRHHPVGHRALSAVDVGQECLERLDPLRDARAHPVPLRLGDHARRDVDRERPFLAADVERHALGEVAAGEGLRAGPKLALRHLAQGLVHVSVGRPHRPGPVDDLVPRLPARVPGEHVAHERTVARRCHVRVSGRRPGVIMWIPWPAWRDRRRPGRSAARCGWSPARRCGVPRPASAGPQPAPPASGPGRARRGTRAPAGTRATSTGP